MGASLKLGIVGCGGISFGQHGPASLATDDIRFAACCDVRADAAQRFAEKFGCESSYGDMAQMLDAEKLDGILLATWPNQHREQIEACLQAGVKNILCEKALTLTGAEAMEIWNLVRDADAFLMEGFMYRHHPAIRKMDELIASDAIGTVDNVRAVFSSFDPETVSADDAERNWRQRKECGGGIPYDFACYCVNACNHFAGSVPKRVFAHGDVSPVFDTINRLYALIEYESGVTTVIESSKKSDTGQELCVTGTTGRLTLPVAWTIGSRCDVIQRNSVGWVRYEEHSYSIGHHNSYKLQLENFVAVVRGEAEPACGGTSWSGIPANASLALNAFARPCGRPT